MRGMVIFSLILVMLVSVSFLAVNINSDVGAAEDLDVMEFSTFTSAVCNENEDNIFCKDEVFVNCNGEISKVIGAAECDGITISVSKATGYAYFDKDWVDPRNLV